LLTARDALEDKLAGFDAGVDDYLPKPFALDELLVRVRALLKRSGLNREPDEGLTVGNVVLFEQERRVLVGGKTVVLTRREFDALFLLAQRYDKVVTREQLLNAWPGTREVNLNTIDVYISYLRKKLTGATVTIETVRGVGFRLIGASAP
jgi:two-component system OmpR family response regulator